MVENWFHHPEMDVKSIRWVLNQSRTNAKISRSNEDELEKIKILNVL
jgi:hypothetical protein